MKIFGQWMGALLGAAILSGAAFAAETAPPTQPATAAANQRAQTFEKQITVRLDYLLSLPSDYSEASETRWPLILFLHGSGERGSDLMKVKKHGPPHIIDAEPDSLLAKKFIVVSPQCPDGLWWKSDDLNLLLDDVMARYHVDADRVYLTGNSMGGFGTWELAGAYPKRFAAIAPICGGGQVFMVRRVKSIPIWVFHGDADKTVPVSFSDDLVAALKKLKADVHYTRYEGVGHDSWTRTYENPQLYEWFLSHHRGETPSAPSDGK